MNDLTVVTNETLPSLLDRASATLAEAKSSAEVLEARDVARVAYDAAKSAGRMAKAKKAHDDVISAVYRAQADALLIEARAKMRLADEYDAAQERGEVAGHGGFERVSGPKVGDDNLGKATAADIGLRRDEIHEARKLRDAEAANPGAAAAALQGMVQRGEEPTKAKLRRELTPERPSESPDINAAARKGLSNLTREGLEDEVIGLREALAEEKAKRKAAEAQVKALKSQLADLTDSDSAAVIRRLQDSLKHKSNEAYREAEKFAAEKRKNYALTKQLKDLENMEIRL